VLLSDGGDTENSLANGVLQLAPTLSGFADLESVLP
jgi:hypothetical protein